MDKLVAYPKEDLELHPHSWDKGLDYEVIDKGKYVTIKGVAALLVRL